MTPDQHIAITAAILTQLQLIIVAAGGLIVLGFTYLATRLHTALGSIEKQGKAVDELQNNGGDSKIELKVLSMIGQGKIPSPSAGPVLPNPVTAPNLDANPSTITPSPKYSPNYPTQFPGSV